MKNMMNRLVLVWISTLLSLGCVTANAQDATQAEVLRQVQTSDASVVILDVRTPEEYAAGHVPGALNIPHDQIESRLGELVKLKDKEIIVYCRTGRRTALAMDSMAKHGFTRMRHLEGDMNQWQENKLPVQTSAAPTAGKR